MAKPPSKARVERFIKSAKLLHAAHGKLRILTTIGWPVEVRERFFARGQKELPRVRYRGFDASAPKAMIREARACLRPVGDGRIPTWLKSSADSLHTTASMLGAVGTREFSGHAQALYGTPTTVFPGTVRTPLELAQQLIRTMRRVSLRMPDPPEPNLKAREVADQIRAAVKIHFGSSAPSVEVVSTLGARASAGPSRIRLRRDALFSDLDVRQLIEHEAFVHVATALNGRRQRKMPLLATPHAGTTRTQEGLAVFAELISGALDPRRLLRLAHRVVAIEMALEGGDFFDVYRYFQEHSQNDIEAFESAARVFRGGSLTEGGPFTKDMVYLDGLCRVHVFVRAAVDTGRVDCLSLLFSGKFDLAHVGALAELSRVGLCAPARFVPRWVIDPRRLVAYFTVTNVIGQAAAGGLRRHYAEQLKATPPTVS